MACELGRLFAHIELERIVLLINDTTDRDVLRDIVERASADLPPDSPNAGRASATVVAFDMGGPAERQPEESLVDWQRRRHAAIDSRRLLGLLADATGTSRMSTPAFLSNDLVLHWSWFPLPAPLRTLRNVAVFVFILMALLPVACESKRSPDQPPARAAATIDESTMPSLAS